ncbi:MAG: RES family NAD+ phosphorylase [Gammaproteobacteria bacterium]
MASSRNLTVWRIVTRRFKDSAFNGEGAKLYGGRWNKKGVPIVYTAATQSLAMLEMLVQDEPLRAHYVMIPAQIPSYLKIIHASADASWEFGALWAKNKTTAVLVVDNAIIPAEKNYLLNPLHPDFHKIIIGEPADFITDPRLLSKITL